MPHLLIFIIEQAMANSNLSHSINSKNSTSLAQQSKSINGEFLVVLALFRIWSFLEGWREYNFSYCKPSCGLSISSQLARLEKENGGETNKRDTNTDFFGAYSCLLPCHYADVWWVLVGIGLLLGLVLNKLCSRLSIYKTIELCCQTNFPMSTTE